MIAGLPQGDPVFFVICNRATQIKENIMNRNLWLFLVFLAVFSFSALCQANTAILTSTSPNHTIATGSDEQVYGTSTSNQITLESGSKAELINFPGNNTIRIQSDGDNFTVFRSGTVVTFQGTDGTLLKIPASTSVQTIEFNGGLAQDLVINNGQVLFDGVPVLSASSITVTGKTIAGLPVVGTVNIRDSGYPSKTSFSAINSDGSYTLHIDNTWMPPFLMWAEGWVNNMNLRLLSSFDLVEGITEKNINLTPATTAIVESAMGKTAEEINPETEPVPDQDTVEQIRAIVEETLEQLFAVIGIPDGFNLFESSIEEVGSPTDQLFDIIDFSSDNQGNITIADASDDAWQVVVNPSGDPVSLPDEMIDSVVQTQDTLTRIKEIMVAYFDLFEDYLPDQETLEAELLPHLAEGFLNRGYGSEDFITWLSEDETAGPVNERLIGCAILRPMTTQYYGLQAMEENHDGYAEAVWALVTSEISSRSFTWLTTFVKDGTAWKWYGNRVPFRITLQGRAQARQLHFPADAVTYQSGLHFWHNDIGNLALNMGISNLAVFNPAFAPEIIDGVAVNCVRLERRSGGLSTGYRLSNVPHYWSNDTLYELSKENGDRLIDLDNLKSQETMEFIAIGLDDDGNPVRTWLYTIPEPPLPVSEIESDSDRYFAEIEQDEISFEPFPGNEGIFSWILPENTDLLPAWATLGWSDVSWNWNDLLMMNPAWSAPQDFSAWTSDQFDPGPTAISPRSAGFWVVMRDTNARHYEARKEYDPWSNSLISVENDHLVFDVSHEWNADNLNPSWSSLNARTRIRGKYMNRFEAPFVVENASVTGNAYVETEIRFGYQPSEDFGNGDTNFIGLWTRIRYQDGELVLQGFVWGSRNADGTDEIFPSPASGNFPYGEQLFFNQTYHLAVEYLENTNQMMIEFTDDSGTYQSYYDMNEIPEFDADNFILAEIRTRVRSLQELGDSGSIRVRIDSTEVDHAIYDTFTGGFSNNKWDILSYE
jgi:hypothetical protein